MLNRAEGKGKRIADIARHREIKKQNLYHKGTKEHRGKPKQFHRGGAEKSKTLPRMSQIKRIYTDDRAAFFDKKRRATSVHAAKLIEKKIAMAMARESGLFMIACASTSLCNRKRMPELGSSRANPTAMIDFGLDISSRNNPRSCVTINRSQSINFISLDSYLLNTVSSGSSRICFVPAGAVRVNSVLASSAKTKARKCDLPAASTE